MANRRRQGPNDKKFDPVDKESPLKLTRQEVSKRELVHAIDLHFREGDPVVIHLLASASRDICAPIVRARGKQTLAESIETRVRDEYVKAWRDHVREPYNFFKHGGTDANKQLKYFDPAVNDMLLFETCADYRAAFDSFEREMLIFQAWHIVTYPNILNEKGEKLFATVSQGFEGLDATGRLRRGRDVLDAIKTGKLS